MNRNGSVGIATWYWLNGLEFESLWGGASFSAPVQTCAGAYPESWYNVNSVFYLRLNRPGRDINHPPPSRVEVNGRVELYLHSSESS